MVVESHYSGVLMGHFMPDVSADGYFRDGHKCLSRHSAPKGKVEGTGTREGVARQSVGRGPTE
jgi:hypothetical protein